AALGVEVHAVPHPVAPVAAALAQPVDEGNTDSGSFHHIRLLAVFPHYIIFLWMLSPPLTVFPAGSTLWGRGGTAIWRPVWSICWKTGPTRPSSSIHIR